jgi:formate dehydrogenase subunit beta
MSTHWQLLTHGQPLATIQQFLIQLFDRAGLHGIVAPLRHPGSAKVDTRFVQDAESLRHIDPFAPIMRCNAAKIVAHLAIENPCEQLGAVLRPCEIRALLELERRDPFDLSRCVIVGVDCVGTFPAEDYAARASFAGGADALTQEVLQFARSVGLGATRYRTACQMCDSHIPGEADVSLSVFGLPAREVVLVSLRNQTLADRLRLPEITDGLADPANLFEHVQVHALVKARRKRNHDRFMESLPQTLPLNVTELAVHLASRSTCRECFKVCPLADGDVLAAGSDDHTVKLSRWLESCVECGMCEQACPRHLLLTVEHEHLRQCLLPEAERAG